MLTPEMKRMIEDYISSAEANWSPSDDNKILNWVELLIGPNLRILGRIQHNHTWVRKNRNWVKSQSNINEDWPYYVEFGEMGSIGSCYIEERQVYDTQIKDGVLHIWLSIL